MKVVVDNISKETKSCTITVNGKIFNGSFIIPSNKGCENQFWVNIHTDAIMNELGAGEHKRWLTIPRDCSRYEGDSTKKPVYPPFVSILNLMEYVTPEEYETARKIFEKATVKLNALKAEAGYIVKA